MIAKPRFTNEDAERANDEWGANCGPGAIAAIAGLTLDELRPHLGDFERKGYTNPTLMLDILGRLIRAGAIKGWRKANPECWPNYGLVRIQWEGPWTAPGVPIRARYRHTHWVGAAYGNRGDGVGVFDINAINNGTGWCSLRDWRETLAPFILENCAPRANGKWHITHVIEVDCEAREAGGA